MAKIEERTHQENFLASMEALGPVPVAEFIEHREAQNESGRLQETENFQGIILATIHLAKGKEYDGVILHDVTLGKLPHQNALEDKRPAYLGSQGIRRLAKLVSTRVELPASYQDKRFEEEVQDLLSSLRREVRLRVDQIKFDKNIEGIDQKLDQEKLMDPTEEERRLLYVGVTRPKHRLILTTRSIFSYPFYNFQDIVQNATQSL
jgi:superfamily I DNA/RNA helicase